MNQNADVSDYIITVDKVEEIAAARILLTVFLQGRYKSPDYFYISSMSEMLKSMESTMSMMSAALGGIAGISLLVAGVGVMNIMLVSVTERTREIGIRKSLGAKKSVILQQFVIEAAVTSSIGGLVGIVLGCVITPAAGEPDADEGCGHAACNSCVVWRFCGNRSGLWIYAGETGGELKSH